MNFINILLGSLLIYSIAIPATANSNRELKKAQQALASEDYEKAFKLYTHIEKNSHNALAQFSLALMYQQGLGRPINMNLACDWFKKSAQGNIPTATHAYAECLEKGVNDEPDFKAAALWYQKAGDLGAFTSYCALGRLYMEGLGVTKQPKKALQLCQLAAEKGSPQSIIQLGHWYLEGIESIRNLSAAQQWFTQGAELNLAEAEFYIAKMIRAGSIKDTNLIDARYWFEKSASQGYKAAYLPTGELYFTLDLEDDRPSAKNLAKSYLWLSVAMKRSSQEHKAKAKKLFNKVTKLMPPEWKKDLDPKISEHIKKY